MNPKTNGRITGGNVSVAFPRAVVTMKSQESDWRATMLAGHDRPGSSFRRGRPPPRHYSYVPVPQLRSLSIPWLLVGGGGRGGGEEDGGRPRRRFPSKHKHGLACMRDATPWYAFDTHVGTHQEARGSCIARSMFDCTLYRVSLPLAVASLSLSLSICLSVCLSLSFPVSVSVSRI